MIFTELMFFRFFYLVVYVRVRLIIFDALWFGGDFAGQVQSLQECLLFSEMQNVQHINSCWSSLGI